MLTNNITDKNLVKTDEYKILFGVAEYLNSRCLETDFHFHLNSSCSSICGGYGTEFLDHDNFWLEVVIEEDITERKNTGFPFLRSFFEVGKILFVGNDLRFVSNNTMNLKFDLCDPNVFDAIHNTVESRCKIAKQFLLDRQKNRR